MPASRIAGSEGRARSHAAKALAVFMVLVMSLSILQPFGLSSGDAGTGAAPYSGPSDPETLPGTTATVVYHPYYSEYTSGTRYDYQDPTHFIEELKDFNNAEKCETRTEIYEGGLFSTEYNPQFWKSTGYDPLLWNGKNWFEITSYEEHHTYVFSGWKYAGTDGKLIDRTYHPGEVIVLEDDGWYARDINSPAEKGIKIADYGKTINIYATWRIAQQVLHNTDPVSDYIMIGNQKCEINGKTITLTYENRTTGNFTLTGPDDTGRYYVVKVYERSYYKTDSGGTYVKVRWRDNPDYIDNLPTYTVGGVSYLVLPETSPGEGDSVACTLGTDPSDNNSPYLNPFWFEIKKEKETDTYGYTYIRGIKCDVYDITSLKCKMVFDGQEISTDVKPINGKIYIGFSRYYAVMGTEYTNTRLISSNLNLNTDMNYIFTNCTIRSEDTDNPVSINMGESGFTVGTGGCTIDNIALNGKGYAYKDNKTAVGLHSGGNLLIVGTKVTSGNQGNAAADIAGYPQIGGNKVIVHSGTFSNVLSGNGGNTCVIIKNAKVMGAAAGTRNPSSTSTYSSYLYICGGEISEAYGVNYQGTNTVIKGTSGVYMFVCNARVDKAYGGAAGKASCNPNIILSGTVTGNFYGGGIGDLTGNPSITVSGTVNGKIYGSVNPGSVNGTSNVTISCYAGMAKITSIQYASNVTVDSSEATLGDSSSDAYALYSIGSLVLKDGSFLYLDSKIGNVGGYSSVDSDGNPTAENSPENELVISGASILSFSTTENGTVTYSPVSGYTLIGTREGTEFTGFVLGSTESENSGFYVFHDDETRLMNADNSEDGAYKCWHVEHIVVIIAKSMTVSDSSLPEASDYTQYTILGLSPDSIGKLKITPKKLDITGCGVYENEFSYEFEYLPGLSAGGDSSLEDMGNLVGFSLRICAYSGTITVNGSAYSSTFVPIDVS